MQNNVRSYADEKFVRTTKNRPCPICGHTSWCSYNSRIAVCMRVTSEKTVRYTNGETGYIHFLDRTVPYIPPTATVQTLPRASADRLDFVYRKLLKKLSLTDKHWDQLQKRGFAPREILRHGFRTLPAKRRDRTVQKLLAEVGDLTGVPGFTKNKEENWLLCGKSGILIPYMDIEGRIVGLQIELDDRSADEKYNWLSSTAKGGWGPGTPVNVVWPLKRTSNVVYITEGGYKPYIVSDRLNVLTIGIPGAGNWRGIIPVLSELKPKNLVIALDVDANKNPDGRPNPHVERYEQEMVAKLQEEGYTVLRATWANEKGPDDVLVAGKKMNLHILNQRCRQCKNMMTYQGLWQNPQFVCRHCGATQPPKQN